MDWFGCAGSLPLEIDGGRSMYVAARGPTQCLLCLQAMSDSACLQGWGCPCAAGAPSCICMALMLAALFVPLHFLGCQPQIWQLFLLFVLGVCAHLHLEACWCAREAAYLLCHSRWMDLCVLAFAHELLPKCRLYILAAPAASGQPAEDA